MNTTSSAPSSLQEACLNELKTRQMTDANFIDKCKETAFATAITANNAAEAAKTISSSNQLEVYGSVIKNFLLGFGGALFLFGLLSLFKRKKS